METLGRLGVGGDCDAFPSWSRCFVLCLMLEIGVTVLVRLMVWFALVHLCLTLGSLWSWFILVVLFNSVVYADFSWFVDCGLVVVCLLLLFLVFWWCDCDSLVDEWSVWWRGGVGWIVRRVAVWLGKMVVYLIVIHGIWVNRVTLIRRRFAWSW